MHMYSEVGGKVCGSGVGWISWPWICCARGLPVAMEGGRGEGGVSFVCLLRYTCQEKGFEGVGLGRVMDGWGS